MKIPNIEASFTRPANTTAYTDGDLVANHATAASVVALKFAVTAGQAGVLIRRARLRKSGTSNTNAAFRLHLFQGNPAPTGGDNAALAVSAIREYLGYIDFSTMAVWADGCVQHGVPAVGSEICAVPNNGAFYGLLEAKGAYTPASAETFAVQLEALLD